ncbi:ABC transporter substrate-binding protein [Streptomyces sp. NBC_00035]|uniref:ABC transporter substrate-binding protein n=1 Tax=Streptomyces sp. NBC_00035 TaxID=2903614 RepID=UPI00324E809B
MTTSVPSRRRVPHALAAGLVLGMIVTAGCSTKATGDDAGSTQAGGVAAGPGVTDTTIKLGVLTDQTGAFAGLGKSVGQGRDLFWSEKNSQGGVCGRKVEFVVKNHGYNTQQAVSAYSQIKDEVLGVQELLGSPMIAALLPSIESDEMLSLVVSWSSTLLKNPNVVVPGSTYDVEMINGLQYLVDSGKLQRGDTISHIYLEGDYGQNALAGSRAAAEKLGLTLKEHSIKPTDSDLTAQVTASRNSSAKAVLLSTAPAQTASAVSVAEASGYDATFLGSNPTFTPTLLSGSAKTALQENFLLVGSTAPFASKAEKPTAVREAYETKYTEQPTSYVNLGYAQAEIMAGILEAACDKKDLTRSGLQTAMRGLSQVDTGGLIAPLDYSQAGAIPAREVYVLRPDGKAAGGLVIAQELSSCDLAKTYEPAE